MIVSIIITAITRQTAVVNYELSLMNKLQSFMLPCESSNNSFLESLKSVKVKVLLLVNYSHFKDVRSVLM